MNIKYLELAVNFKGQDTTLIARTPNIICLTDKKMDYESNRLVCESFNRTRYILLFRARWPISLCFAGFLVYLFSLY